MFEWLLDLPKYIAQGVEWLNTDLSIGTFHFTPLSLFGSGFLVFIGIVVALKIKNLII